MDRDAWGIDVQCAKSQEGFRRQAACGEAYPSPSQSGLGLPGPDAVTCR
jgi:hypothetical protein